jgi:hypothetical protein
MNKEILSGIFNLRNSIAYLAENKNWLKTAFFSESSSSFLSYAFPKTAVRNSIFYLEPMRYLVDKEVGANYYHLFRLPIQLEEQLYRFENNLNEHKISKETAIDFLNLTKRALIVDRQEGPILVGSTENLDLETIQTISAHYVMAFENDYKVHPYLN